MRVIQAIWPSILLAFYSCGFFISREWWLGIFVIALVAWTACALVLDPKRRWTWWTCLTPVALCALAGVVYLGSIVHMFLFPNHAYWETANQPGAIALIAGLFLLVPSSVLFLHLMVIRRQFS